jgi:hypothetical protein
MTRKLSVVHFDELIQLYKRMVDLPLILEAYLVFDMIVEEAYKMLHSLGEQGIVTQDKDTKLFCEYILSLDQPTKIIELHDILEQLLNQNKIDFLPIGNLAHRQGISFKKEAFDKLTSDYKANAFNYFPTENEMLMKNYWDYVKWLDVQKLNMSSYHKIARVYAVDCLKADPLKSLMGGTDYDAFFRVFIVDVYKFSKNITIGQLYAAIDDLSRPAQK